MIKIKYILPCLLLLCGVSAAKLNAQATPTPTKALDGTFGVVNGPGVATSASPESEEYKRTGERFDNEVDDFLDVNNWTEVAQNLSPFFVFGHLGDFSVNSMSDVSFGAAFKLKANYFALYYEGFENNAIGWNNKQSGAISYSASGTNLNPNTFTDRLALLFARDSIGAVRLDLLFNGLTTFSSEGPGDGKSSSDVSNDFGARVQWGKNFELPFGTFKPNAAVGFFLPAVDKTTDSSGTFTTTGSAGNYPAGYSYDPTTGAFIVNPGLGRDGLVCFSIGLDLARKYWEFALDYNLYADLGYRRKYSWQDEEISRDGQFWQTVSLNASRTWALTDKISASIQPKLIFGFYNWDGIYKSGNDSIDYGSFFGFELNPVLYMGIRYQVKETVALYAGSTIDILHWRTADKSKGSLDNGASVWSVDGSYGPDINLGVTWTPVPALSIEFGFDNLIDFVSNFGSGSNSLSGGILLRYKPQANPASAAPSASATSSASAASSASSAFTSEESAE